MIDFHNHLLPGVDDGAATLEEAKKALVAMVAAGVDTLVLTPHLDASDTEDAETLRERLGRLDEAFHDLTAFSEREGIALRLERGAELMLDSPEPDVTDDRVRLAGTRFLLVEFPALLLPPHSGWILYELRARGWHPVVAHPERYRNLTDLTPLAELRNSGCLFQVNSGSLVGRYGATVQNQAWSLLGRGWVDYLSSDYHARGRLAIEECRNVILSAGGEEQWDMLTRSNPERLLAGEDPENVPPLVAPSFWQRLFRARAPESRR